MERFGIGQALQRGEDGRFLTGQACYTADIDFPDAVTAVVLRSPCGHARIRRIDPAAAMDMPGVLAVFTAADLEAEGIGDIPCDTSIRQRDGSPVIRHDRPVLARGHVRHSGEPVALIVAESLQAARDAAEAVEVDYDLLPVVTETASAALEGATQIWPDAPRNTALLWELGDAEATSRAFASAPRRVSLSLVNNRVIPAPMEPRAAAGIYRDGTYTLHTPSQGVHYLRDILAADVLKISADSLRVVTPDVGGGFGTRLFCYPEHALVLFAARRIGRPVRWVGERAADGFTGDSHGRDQAGTAELALDNDGRFLALRATLACNLGAYLSAYGPFVATAGGCRMLSGVYRIPAIHVSVTGVYTNSTPVDAYRGAGRPEAAYLVERLVDLAARETGLDPAALRLRNFIPPEAMPYKTATGQTYDNGEFAAIMQAALQRADQPGFAARRRQSAARGLLRGFGFACYIEACGAGSGERAVIHTAPDGRITLLIGSQCNGQGHRTAYRQIAADILQIDPARIEVVQGDTAQIPTGSGTGGSRAVSEGGVASRDAARALIEAGRNLAASHLEASAEDVVFAAGVFSIAGTDLALDLAALAGIAAKQGSVTIAGAPGPGLAAEAFFRGSRATYPNGCHVCEVEVDPETGTLEILRYTVMDDFGTVINPLLLAGQVHGGIAQGVGQAVLEHVVYDPQSGALLSGSFTDYALPRADDLPAIDLSWRQDIPATGNPMGIKGAGEAGAIGAPAAIVNAVLDALRDHGVTRIDMPLTPQRIWRAIRTARAGKDEPA